MTYRIGDVEVQGKPHSNVIEMVFGQRRRMLMRINDQPVVDRADDLMMDHSDTAPCEYVAPDWDGA